jgi:hypothetical protein
MKIILEYPAPESEISSQFLQGMVNRMAISYYKYGLVAQVYPHKISALNSMELRLQKYQETGNTEYLMDAANFLMIEFMHPSHTKAHFEATDSSGSPGRVWKNDINHTQRPNIDKKIED